MASKSRRTVFATVALALAGGCLESAGSSAPDYDCDEAARPSPTGSDSTDIERQSYPEPPAEFTRSSVRTFLEAYEAAYAHNESASRYEITSILASASDARIHSDDDGTYLYSVQYNKSLGFEDDAGHEEGIALYYLTETPLFRTEIDTATRDELSDPQTETPESNPRRDPDETLVECF